MVKAKSSGRTNNVPGFLSKCFEIFSNPEFESICGFGPQGDTVIIKKSAEFSAHVLPRYFKHDNVQSFVRQLNMYDFRKTVQDSKNGEFKHPLFKKGQRHLLHLIKRKVRPSPAEQGDEDDSAPAAKPEPQPRPPRPASVAKLAAVVPTAAMVQQTDKLAEELRALQEKQKDTDHKLELMDRENESVKRDNIMLWHTLRRHASKQKQVQHRMQQILVYMYQMCVAAGCDPGTKLGALLSENLLELPKPPSTSFIEVEDLELGDGPGMTGMRSSSAASDPLSHDELVAREDEGGGGLSRMPSVGWIAKYTTPPSTNGFPALDFGCTMDSPLWQHPLSSDGTPTALISADGPPTALTRLSSFDWMWQLRQQMVPDSSTSEPPAKRARTLSLGEAKEAGDEEVHPLPLPLQRIIYPSNKSASSMNAMDEIKEDEANLTRMDSLGCELLNMFEVGSDTDGGNLEGPFSVNGHDMPEEEDDDIEEEVDDTNPVESAVDKSLELSTDGSSAAEVGVQGAENVAAEVDVPINIDTLL